MLSQGRRKFLKYPHLDFLEESTESHFFKWEEEGSLPFPKDMLGSIPVTAEVKEDLNLTIEAPYT